MRIVFFLLVTQAAMATPRSYSAYTKLDVFARVLAHVENHYVDEIDEQKLLDGAIRGMLAELDPHSAYLGPQESQGIRGDTRGVFGGIGVEVELRDGSLAVITPIEGTPAARAGILPGDRIIAINGRPTDRMTPTEVVGSMRGPEGSRLELSVIRQGWDEARKISLVREIIRLISVEGKLLAGKIGLVRIKNFQADTHRYLASTLDRLEGSAGGKLAGIVLDLRNNPGGLLDQAVRISDAFMKKGVIVRTVGRGGRLLEEERAHARPTRAEAPMAVLVNGGSASAAEIVAGALQDQKRAILVGEKTYGKASVQTIIEFDDGSALKLTVARYTTPAGRFIHEKGIQPDVVVKAGEKKGEDLVLTRAVALLKGREE